MPHTGFSEEALQAAREFSNSATKAKGSTRPEPRMLNQRGSIRAPLQARGRGGSLLNNQGRVASDGSTQSYLATGNVLSNNRGKGSLQYSIKNDATDLYPGRGEFGSYRALSIQQIKSPASQRSPNDSCGKANSSFSPLASTSRNIPHQGAVQTTSLTIPIVGQSFGKRGLAGSRWAETNENGCGATSFNINSNQLCSGLENVPPYGCQRDTALSHSSHMTSEVNIRSVEVPGVFLQDSEFGLQANTWSSGVYIASQKSHFVLLDQVGDVEATPAQESNDAGEVMEDLIDLDAKVRVCDPSEVLAYGLSHYRPVSVTPTGHFLDDPIVASCTKGVLQPDQSQVRGWKSLQGLKNSRWADSGPGVLVTTVSSPSADDCHDSNELDLTDFMI